jgi:hypothetical protein
MSTNIDDLIKLEVEIADVDPEKFPEFAATEVMLGESLKTPGLQTSIKINNGLVSDVRKDLDQLKGKGIIITITRETYKNDPAYQKYNIPSEMAVGYDGQHVVYRLEERNLQNYSAEEFTLRGCDNSLLKDASGLISKSWKCTSPSKITKDILTECLGVPSSNQVIESSTPNYDYIARNIHAFQAINQQTNAALAKGDDPSFLHFMTYDPKRGVGIHHFESLKSMCEQTPVMTFNQTDTAELSGFLNPIKALAFSFPCDFDLLSDILNGIGPDGKDISSLAVFNPKNRMISLLGNQNVGCGVGGGVFKTAQTNINTAKQQDTCASDVEKYRLKRQARMSLLEKDKIALRMTVPFNPKLNAGKVITFNYVDETGNKLYGAGDYLILNLYHHIKNGGYGTTVIDCVSKTVGSGEV